jgi:hypothetical protein
LHLCRALHRGWHFSERQHMSKHRASRAGLMYRIPWGMSSMVAAWTRTMTAGRG